MIDLKTHNDLVQKLMKDNDRLELELKDVTIKLRKAESAKQVEGLKDRELGKKVKDDVGKINKLQKEFKDKIDQMNKIVMQRDLEITELKERLEIKLNIDDKQKDHLLETFKKWQGRKPNSSNDYKFMSVINHYEGQIQKLEKQINTLKSQSTNYQELTRTLKKQLIDKENQNLNIGQVERQALIFQDEIDNKMSKLESDRLQKQIVRKDRRIESLQKQIGQLRNRYEDLTKEYYKMVNQYGELGKTQKTIPKPRSKPPTKHSPYVQTIQDVSLAYSMSSKNEPVEDQTIRQFNYCPTAIQPPQSAQSKRKNQIINRLLEVLELTDQQELIPSIIKLDVAIKSLTKMETCLKSIKDSFQKILDRKINLVRIKQPLEEIQQLVGEAVSNKAILRQIQIKLGSKKQQLLSALDKIRNENRQYYDSLKNITYIKDLQLTKQIQEFIDLFKLDPTQQLPLQIRQLYQQLKSLFAFTSMCNKLLESNLPVPECLQKVLSLIERMKLSPEAADYDILSKLQKQLHVERYQLLPKVRELAKKVR